MKKASSLLFGLGLIVLVFTSCEKEPAITPKVVEISTEEVVMALTNDTVGLAVDHIEKNNSAGTYFISGDFNKWGKTTIVDTRVINGRTFLLWKLPKQKNPIKFGFGKKLIVGESWNYSPDSKYWQKTPEGGLLCLNVDDNGNITN